MEVENENLNHIIFEQALSHLTCRIQNTISLPFLIRKIEMLSFIVTP